VRVYLGRGGRAEGEKDGGLERGGSRQGIETYLLAQLAPVQAAATPYPVVETSAGQVRRARDTHFSKSVRPCKLNSGRFDGGAIALAGWFYRRRA